MSATRPTSQLPVSTLFSPEKRPLVVDRWWYIALLASMWIGFVAEVLRLVTP